MAEEISNDEKMRTFIMALLDEFYPECGDIDGGTFQDLAEKHGILIPEIKYQPCGEFCKCNEVVYDEEWQDGVTCYHAAEWLRSRPTQDVADLLPRPACCASFVFDGTHHKDCRFAKTASG